MIFRFWLRGLLLVGAITLTLSAGAADEAKQSGPDFGADVKLAPFVVNGKKLSISIHARTNADRRYAEKFAEEVVEIAYETMGDSTGRGLVIVGAKGEPHPYYVYRKFLALADARKISPTMMKSAQELDGRLQQWRLDTRMDEKSRASMALDFDTMVKAVPMPLEGAASMLYQLAWSERFDDTRIEQRMMTLTRDDLLRDDLKRYDWVFYLPPSDVTAAALKEIVNKGMAKEKMGLLKRAAISSAMVIFSPAVKKGIEGMRKGILYMTVLRAESGYSKEDIMALTSAYVKVMMPDFKFNGGTEHKRALEAIEAQKIKNAEYAKDPFVSPVRLGTFDSAAYASFEGEYTTVTEIAKEKGKEKGAAKPLWSFKRNDESYAWQYKDRKPLLLYPAGDRLLVTADGKMTVQFQVDEQGAVTGAEERRARYRRTFLRKL